MAGARDLDPVVEHVLDGVDEELAVGERFAWWW